MGLTVTAHWALIAVAAVAFILWWCKPDEDDDE